jgi:stage II sporulation protein D
MKRLLMLVLLCSGTARAAETMRVSMGEPVAKALVEASALESGVDDDDAEFTALEAKKATLKVSAGHAWLDGVDHGLAVRLRAPGGGAISVNGTRVRGEVAAVAVGQALVLVNVIALEDYLSGVLGSEMPAQFPLEALKAQAVAARTYALERKLETLGQPYHLSSSVLSQVYGGLAAEDPRTQQAVEATRGQVLTFQLQPIEAYFHASCGGKTESGLQALGRDLPYLRPVSCPCNKLPNTKWSLELSEADAKTALGKTTELRVEGRTPTGRARRVELGAGRSIDAVTFRERLGYGKVKSLSFDVESDRHGWKLEGKGFGHGAGLCQWGAKMLAEQGQGYRQILEHYYGGTELQTLY